MKPIESQDNELDVSNINATKITATAIGVLGGVISMEHGFFETLQGNTPTDGILIEAIGQEHRFWAKGSEAALTLIPNFLITGIVAIIIGLLVIIWSIKYIDKKYGSLGLFILTMTVLLVGGGIAFFIIGIGNSIIATRINKPLKSWRKILPTKVEESFSKIWLPALISTMTLFSIMILMGIFGVPLLDESRMTNFIYFVACISLGLMIFTIIVGFTHDIHCKSH